MSDFETNEEDNSDNDNNEKEDEKNTARRIKKPYKNKPYEFTEARRKSYEKMIEIKKLKQNNKNMKKQEDKAIKREILKKTKEKIKKANVEELKNLPEDELIEKIIPKKVKPKQNIIND